MKRLACILTATALTLTGCSLVENWGKTPTTLSIHEQVPTTLPETHMRKVEIPNLDLKVAVNPLPSLTQLQIASAEMQPTIGGSGLLLHFDGLGGRILQQVTTQSRGKYLVFLLNQRPVSAWWVDRSITNGEFLLEGFFSDEEAKEAARSLTKQARKRSSKY